MRMKIFVFQLSYTIICVVCVLTKDAFSINNNSNQQPELKKHHSVRNIKITHISSSNNFNFYDNLGHHIRIFMIKRSKF